MAVVDQKAEGHRLTAPPSARPALTKPNTLPIWPGGAASLTMTSRGVRLAPIARPPVNPASADRRQLPH